MLPIKLIILPAFLLFFLVSCHNGVDVTTKEIVEKPEEINAKAEDIIQGTLKEILKNSDDLADSFKIKNAAFAQSLYAEHSFQLLWSSNGKFTNKADSLLSLIGNSRIYGLFPNDYYYARLIALKNQLITDTSSKEKKLDASLWAYSDLMMTSAFMQLIKDIKIGRLLPDSVIAKDSSLTPAFFQGQFKRYELSGNADFASGLEPNQPGYKKIRLAMDSFLLKANFKNYTLISTKDSSQLPTLVYKRLMEDDSTLDLGLYDSLHLSTAIKKYQKEKNLKIDGKISGSLISRLNNTDKEKFICAAINLDRYKQLEPLPVQYIWVNLPSYYLQLKDSDSVVINSRVVVGKPTTRTPIITSAISDMITYPKWTIPESIIKKEVLPALKKDPGYLARKGFSLVDKDGNEVNPYTVTWSKYKDFIPYKVVQGSGDDNALGILKFNFPNKYSVYLHDTNQRYLFSKTSRALSHGCVRVQSWESLAKYILRNDSSYSANAIPVDSMESWLARKEKRYIPVRKPIPLFIRYFTCDVDKDHLVFYEDIYGEDKKIREKIFANK